MAELTTASRAVGAIRGAKTQNEKLLAELSGADAQEMKLALAEMARAEHRVAILADKLNG